MSESGVGGTDATRIDETRPRMIPCPSDEQLAALLEERLDVAALATVETHLEGCARCQQALEELTYQRFSAAEWHAPGESTTAEADRPTAPSPEGVVPLDSKLEAEQSARRKRLILESSPRQPSSIHFSPADRLLGPDQSASYPPQVDGYDIVGRLGRGGMGVVYRARQHGLDRLVALKMLRSGGHADAETLARFRIEVRAVARLRHPNIVQVFDVGESRGLPFVALELLEGGSLDTRNAGTPRPEREAASLGATLARAIASAHQAGIVHRDLKPANVLFTRDGIAKITDFGLAKRLDEDDGATTSGQVMGSPSFMSPEQARGEGKEVGPVADVYSLGVILYEMLTGRPPFKGGSALETLHQVLHVEPVAPSRLRPGLARDLETICLKCLSKDASLRYPTANALADDLDRFQAGAPITARRVRPLERAWKWARREPATAALVLGLTLAITGSVGVGLRAIQIRGDQLERLRVDAARTLIDAGQAARDGRWTDGRTALTRSLRELDAQPTLNDLRDQTADLLAQIEGRARLDRFRTLARQAQLDDARWLQATRQTSGDPRPVRAAAEAALAEVGRFDRDSAGAIVAWRLDDSTDRELPERAALDLGCRELVALWVESTAAVAPGEDPLALATRALGLLDRTRDWPESKAKGLLRASLFDRLGDPGRASDERHRADGMAAVDALDWTASGRAAYRRDDLPRAIADFEAALGIDPNSFRAQLDLAVAQLRSGQPEPARASLTACLLREPKSISLLLLRGLALGEAGGKRLDRQRTTGDPASPADADHLFQLAEADFAAAFDLQPSDRDQLALLLNRGIVRVRAERFDDAEADFAASIHRQPDAWPAHVNRGQALHRLGRIAEAIAEFTTALTLQPDQPDLYRARALARLDPRVRPDQAARDLAIADLTEAIERDPEGSSARADDHARRARLEHLAGRFEATLADADEALRIKPDQADAALVRVQTLLKLKRHPEVVRACDEALRHQPDNPDFWELRGVARSFGKDFLGAVDDHTHALSLDPERVSARVQRGWTYLLSDAPKLALADFEAVIRRDPTHAEAFGGRGFALALTGHFRAATLDAEESVRLASSDDARILYNAARVYAKSAANLATAPGGKRALTASTLADDYQDRALVLLQQAIDAVPGDRRPAFRREVVAHDPALAVLRQRPSFGRLAGLGETP